MTSRSHDDLEARLRDLFERQASVIPVSSRAANDGPTTNMTDGENLDSRPRWTSGANLEKTTSPRRRRRVTAGVALLGAAAVVAVIVAVVAVGSGTRQQEPGGRPNITRELAHVKRFVPPPTQAIAPTTTTTTTLPPASREKDALALARALGCTHTTIAPEQRVAGFPTPTQSVGCTIRTVDISVEVFASHAELASELSPSSRLATCALYSVFGENGPIYMVNGDDFSVTAITASTLHSVSDTGTLAQAEALSAALDLPITRIDC